MILHNPLTYTAAFTIGLLGAGHCFGMCGGIVNSLSMAAASGKSKQKTSFVTIHLSYNLGRLTSYTLIGFLTGLLGWILAKNGVINYGLRTIAGLIMITTGLYIASFWNGLLKLEAMGQYLWRYIQPVAQKFIPVTNHFQALSLGMLWGWLPCGLIYSTAIWASTAGSPDQSALLMLSFGIGTLPALLSTGLAAQKLASFIKNRNIKRISGIFLILFGIWTFPFVGMQLSILFK